MANYIYLGALSPVDISPRTSGRIFLETLLAAAPDWTPEKYNHFEPVNRPFDPANLEEALDSWQYNFFWARKKPTVRGSVWSGNTSSIYIEVAPRGFETESAPKFLQAYQRHFPIHLAYVHVQHQDDSDVDIERFDRAISPFIMGVTIHRLQEGVPDVPWSIFFGPRYIELFGRERLLSTPAARVEEMAGGIYIQLTASIADVAKQRASYLTAQKAARDHLNRDFTGTVPPIR